MQYDQKQFTQKGLDMFSSALSNKAPITVDKVIVDDLPTNNFNNLALLSLDSFADAMSFQANYTETSNNTLTVDAVMSNKGFQSPYTVQEIGLVGHVGDDTNGQSLMAILVASDPFTLPAQQNDETPSQFIPNITIQLANNDMGQVPVLVQDDAYIAQKDLDKLVADNGYIKLTDADNRYVKQTDFQNEVNNSVNEKADKSDLSNLQSNINNDVQPQLNQKANQSDLNTTNGSVSSLQSNKADKGDVTGQINQTLSQATAHSDQNLSTANNHSDSNYNDLSNKNNILSSQLNDSQKPNLVDLNMNSWLNTGNDANTTMFQVNNVYFEAGKSYWFSLQYQDGSWKDTNPSMMFYKNDWDSFNGDYWILSYDPSHNKNTLNPIFHYVPQQDETVNIRLTRWSSTNEPIYIRGFTITQTDNYLPFEQAEINRKAWQSASQTDLDNAKSDFTNKTNDLSNTMNQQFSQATAHSDQNLSNVQGQIASIKANAWRELKIVKYDPNSGNYLSMYNDDFVFCKIDFNNNTATLYGHMSYTAPGIFGFVIYSGNDFRFSGPISFYTSNGGPVPVSENENGDLDYNNTASIYNITFSSTIAIQPK